MDRRRDLDAAGPRYRGDVVEGRCRSLTVLRSTGRPGDPFPADPSTLAIPSAVWTASYRCSSALFACSRFLLLRSRL
jgi:hypothetical protein